MKKIAFVYTEYQQNILFSICLQDNIEIEILFLREGVPLHKNADTYVHKVVYYEDILFSWRSIWKYYLEYKKKIAPYLDRKNSYRIFTWSTVTPLSRYAINFTQCKDINLIEDGSGSYAKWGFNNYNLGLKTFAVSTFIFWFTNIFSRSIMPLKPSDIHGWSLLDGCYPEFDIEKNIIDHHFFQKVLRDSLAIKSKDIEISHKAVIFITSPYVEFGILTEDEYTRIMIESMEKIKKQKKGDLNTVYWKLHPRTNIEDEEIRLRNIHTMTNINFEILCADSNIELIALDNQERNLQYYSIGSSSLYVIKALISEEATVCLVESEELKRKVMNQAVLIELYKSIGIGIL